MNKLIGAAVMLVAAQIVSAGQSLRLVPFPREVELRDGGLKLQTAMVITAPPSVAGRAAAEFLRDELRVIAGVVSSVEPADFGPNAICLSSHKVPKPQLPDAPRESEGYSLAVSPQLAVVAAQDEAGLLHGAQALRQLIRANLRDGAIPALSIRDWPALKHRGFSDDITRGPSPKLSELRREIDLTALLKMNFFTYYLEYQYAFRKRPEIGPADGSLKAEELSALVEYAAPLGVEIIGNQQSFGHFAAILRHEKYAPLRETPHVLNPTHEDTYKLLDDLYSEQAPLLKSRLFNVCCDETQGLGEGPANALAEKMGVGGVYVQHIQRVHGLLAGYGKRMMMWGDIILGHPDRLKDIPGDVIMLSWGYDPNPSFEAAVTPFAKAGFEFFVCPGVSCWSRILPNFGVAVTNIQNYVRDGVAQGAAGMLNTTWDDDGENFNACNWHGIAWGAECAWNASKTPIADFNRRVGAVLFGEQGDEFGRAIELLAKAHALPAYGGMFNSAFWNLKLAADKASARKNAAELLAITRPALEHLRAARAAARVNAGILDYYIFGAERMQLIATRTIDELDAAAAMMRSVARSELDATAVRKGGTPSDSGEVEADRQKARDLIAGIRDRHAQLKERYLELWVRENRPYALDWVLKRFDAAIAHYDPANLTRLVEVK